MKLTFCAHQIFIYGNKEIFGDRVRNDSKQNYRNITSNQYLVQDILLKICYTFTLYLCTFTLIDKMANKFSILF